MKYRTFFWFDRAGWWDETRFGRATTFAGVVRYERPDRKMVGLILGPIFTGIHWCPAQKGTP